MNIKFYILIIVGVISFHLVFIRDAYAYLDHNSASLAVQAILELKLHNIEMLY